MKRIAINCDLGEGKAFDEQLMPLIDACSIACGGHFGDEVSMKKTIDLAMKYKVKMGAHPSFPDRSNFGRKPLYFTTIKNRNTEAYIDRSVLIDSLENQINQCRQLIESAGGVMDHIKAHGALYNLLLSDEEYAFLFIELIQRLDPKTHIYIPWNATLVQLAQKQEIDLSYTFEAFADRRYTADGKLLSRAFHNATISDSELAWKQVVDIHCYQKLQTVEGKIIPFKAETFCVHGDTKNAMEIVSYIRSQEAKRDD